MGQEKNPQTQEEFLDFELEIGMGSDRTYPIAVVGSPAGEAHEQMHFPYDTPTLEIQLLTLQNALLRSGAGSRQVLLPEQQKVQDFGRTLFTTLFTGEVGNLYAASRDRAAEQGKGLRLKLRILAPEMASLPWEFVYDPAHAEYLCLSRYTPLIRYIELPQPPRPLSVVLPLRILGMIAAPANLPVLDSKGEQQRIEKALQPLQQRGLVQLTWLAGQTWQAVQQAMRQGPWHIFHFIGHGSFDSLADEGVIAFADEAGQAQLLRATQLGTLLADQRPLRLVVLNACQGAEGSRQDVFSSTASILVRSGLPAVLAMQYSITDTAAIAFSRAFYEALAEGLPVDAVVSEARKAVSLGGGDTLEWGIPVLFMRSPDGVLFTIDRSVTPPPPQPAPPAQPTPPVTAPQVTAAGSLLSRRNLLIGLGGLAAAGVTAGGVWLTTHPRNPPPPPTPTPTPTEIPCNPIFSSGGPTSPGTGEILLFSGDISAKGARIYVNGACEGRMLQRDNGAIHLIAQVPPGTYQIKVMKPGYRDFVRSVTVIAGQRSELDFDLEPIT